MNDLSEGTTSLTSLVTKRLSPSDHSSTEDECDSYGRRKSKGRTKRRRLHATEITRTAEVRFSSRSAGKVTNYNEEESDNFSDEDEAYDYSTTVQTAYEAEVPAIELILDYRPKSDASMLPQSLLKYLCVHEKNRSKRFASNQE